MSNKPVNSGDKESPTKSIPDWRFPEEYPSPETTTPEMWAWEFLRRNESYQKDYMKFSEFYEQKKFKEAFFTLHGDNNATEEQITKACIAMNEVTLYVFPLSNKYKIAAEKFLPNPAFSSNELFKFHTKKEVAYYGYPDPENPVCRPKDGVNTTVGYPIDSFVSSLVGKFDPRDWMRESICKENMSQEVYITMSPRRLLVGISLEGNIKEQIDELHVIARKKQELLREWGIIGKKGRKESALYRDYLRCLDAVETGAGKKEIVERLLPDELNEYPSYNATKKINNWLKRAKELRDRDYIKLSKL